MATKKQTGRWVIVTSQYRDLYYGLITATDKEISETHAVRVERCRHIAYWTGPKGGLTSLAVEGPAAGSRIGGETSVLITGVAHVLNVTEAAQVRFAAVK